MTETIPAPPDNTALFTELYATLWALLGKGCTDRAELAAVGAWSAFTGRNIALIARSMQRSRPWVRARLTRLEELLLPLTDAEVARMLGGAD